MHLVTRERPGPVPPVPPAEDRLGRGRLSCLPSLVALAASTLACLAAAPGADAADAAAGAFEARVVRFVDGDTLVVQQRSPRGAEREVKVRLRWADAPEVAHARNQIGQAGGVAAREFAEAMWRGRTVRVVPRGTSYERIVADVDCGGVSLGYELVRAGHAQLDPRYKPPASWTAAERQARAAGRGLWNQNKYGRPLPPWEFRREQREKGRTR